MKRLPLFFLMTLTSFAAAHAQTVVGLWRMGEDDVGAVAGNAVNSPSTPSFGTALGKSGGALTYSSNTPGAASSLAVSFNGGYYAATPASGLGLTNNFTLETWVNFTSVSTTQWVMVVGTSFFSVGIQLDGTTGKVGGAVTNNTTGNFAFGQSSALSTSTWYHVALVVDNVGTGTFYLNGHALPNPATIGTFGSRFLLGADSEGAAKLSGLLDQTDVFTFSTGTFSPSMLNYSTFAVPEPSTSAALAGIATLGLAVWRRRSRVTRT